MSLQFNDTSASKNGLIQFCESTIFGDNSYGKISDDPDLLATFTRNLNQGLNRVTSLIIQSDGRWQFDDSNHTDYPIATTDIVENQQDYTLAVSHLNILRVEVEDETGNSKLLDSIDKTDLYDQSITDFLKTAGLPTYYDKLATSLFLYPKPNYSREGALKVFFQRPPSYFVTTDTTKAPGFNSLYHSLVALIACRDYALDRILAIADGLSERVQLAEQDLIESYALRNQDEKIALRARPKNYR